ncbi:hypothetical protein GALL_55970 [mine drainage metagenome]|uniref:Uncharacterized protein n=1 Tax=mine drainage metagenome TaxID=410659 RepID=A0A1J5THM3_9ZZZZ
MQTIIHAFYINVYYPVEIFGRSIIGFTNVRNTCAVYQNIVFADLFKNFFYLLLVTYIAIFCNRITTISFYFISNFFCIGNI